MLRVTVELVPFGDEDRKKKIAEMVIANAEGRGNLCAYEAWTAEDDWSGESAMYGRLEEFDRRKSVWELVRLMLEVIRLEKPEPSEEKGSLAQRLKKRLLGNGAKR